MRINNLVLDNENLTKMFRKGRLALAAVALSFSLAGCTTKEAPKPVESEVAIENNEEREQQKKEVTVQDINDLNFVLCNDQCNPILFDKVVEKLSDAGIKVSTVNLEDNTLQDQLMANIITLDGHSYTGEGIVINGACLENHNDSDTLALAMEAGLKNTGNEVVGVRLGVTEYGKDVSERVPSRTEELKHNSSSFVMLSIGTNLNDVESLADGIFDGILRSTKAIEEMPNADFLHLTSYTDTIDAMANTWDVDKEWLMDVNQIEANEILPKGSVLKNPMANRIDALNEKEAVHLAKTDVSDKSL